MERLTEFTPWAALAGGLMIGTSAVLLMASVGRIAGISGLIYQVMKSNGHKEVRWHATLFLLGIFCAVPLWLMTMGVWPEQWVSDKFWQIGIAGGLVGFGAAFGNGCTSGHGVCGISRGSLRSILATVTFMLTAMLTVWIVRHYFGA